MAENTGVYSEVDRVYKSRPKCSGSDIRNLYRLTIYRLP